MSQSCFQKKGMRGFRSNTSFFLSELSNRLKMNTGREMLCEKGFRLLMQFITKFFSFVQDLDRLLHCDQSSYAVQLFAGSDQFPGPTIRLFEGAMAVSFSFKCTSVWLKNSLRCYFYTK